MKELAEKERAAERLQEERELKERTNKRLAELDRQVSDVHVPTVASAMAAATEVKRE